MSSQMTGMMDLRRLRAPVPARTSRRRPGEDCSPTRGAVLTLIEQKPGIHVAEIQRRLDRAEATIRHHVNRLSRMGLVRRRPIGRDVALFPPHANSSLDQAAHAYRCADGVRIVAALLRRPASTLEDLAEALAEPVTVTRRRVLRLRRTGLIVTEGGRPHRLSVDPAVWSRLAPLLDDTARAGGPARLAP